MGQFNNMTPKESHNSGNYAQVYNACNSTKLVKTFLIPHMPDCSVMKSQVMKSQVNVYKNSQTFIIIAFSTFYSTSGHNHINKQIKS